MKAYIGKQTNPVFRTSIHLQKTNIAGFRLLKNFPLIHGFTYGKGSQNMSYKWEPGFTDEATKNDAIERVKKRIENHLSLLNMETITKSVFLQAVSGDTKIVDVSMQTIALNQNTDRGIFLSGGAVFTHLQRIPLLMTAGDCHMLIIYAANKFGINITGLVHAGRRELDQELPKLAIAHLISYYGCEPAKIYIGIVQGIGPINHTIQPQDISKELKNLAMWQPQLIPNGPFHLDNLRLLVDQIGSFYIPGKNIEAYNTDNYELALSGKSFSHRAKVAGRILISTQLI